jgi:hypothetical protein
MGLNSAWVIIVDGIMPFSLKLEAVGIDYQSNEGAALLILLSYSGDCASLCPCLTETADWPIFHPLDDT